MAPKGTPLRLETGLPTFSEGIDQSISTMIVQLGKSDNHKLERIHAREIDYYQFG
jgi:hypothetical protein